jgi:hypothetical protein
MGDLGRACEVSMKWWDEVKEHGLQAAVDVADLEMRGNGGITPCPACGATKRGSERRVPIGTNAEGGWECHSCDAKGDAADLLAYAWESRRLSELDGDGKDRVRARAAAAGLCSERDADASQVLPAARKTPVSTVRRVNRDGDGAVVAVEVQAKPREPGEPSGRPPPWSDELCREAERVLWGDTEAEPVRKYLTGGPGEGPGGTDGRRLSKETCRDFHLGAILWDGWWWVVLPILDARSGEPVNAKFRRVPNDAGEAPKPKYTSCAGRPLTLWGEKSLTNDLAAHVIVVEGEFDVLALWEYGFRGSVVSGTAGAGAFRDEWLDTLEPYQSFILAYDVEESGVGEEGASGLADKLGRWRCARAQMPMKDASECWLRGVTTDEIEAAIDRARPYVGMEVFKANHWQPEIERDILHPQGIYGLPTGSINLDAMLSGWPVGVTVLTGPTKAGKSSFLIWAMRELALRGIPGVLTGFENGAKKVQHKLLRMQLGGDFMERTAADRARAFNDLSRMPLHTISHYGSAKLDDLIATMRYYKRRHGVKAILVDHLGFLVDLANPKFDETRQLQHAMRTLVTVANDEEMTAFVIAHPVGTPERQRQRVRIFDIKSTSSIQQDCALGLSLEILPRDQAPAPGVKVHLDAKRSEYGGLMGSACWMFYDLEAGVYADRMEDLPNELEIKPNRS